jgi:hypothetical protein
MSFAQFFLDPAEAHFFGCDLQFPTMAALIVATACMTDVFQFLAYVSYINGIKGTQLIGGLGSRSCCGSIMSSSSAVVGIGVVGSSRSLIDGVGTCSMIVVVVVVISILFGIA